MKYLFFIRLNKWVLWDCVTDNGDGIYIVTYQTATLARFIRDNQS